MESRSERPDSASLETDNEVQVNGISLEQETGSEPTIVDDAGTKDEPSINLVTDVQLLAFNKDWK